MIVLTSLLISFCLLISAKPESLASQLGTQRDKYPLHYLAFKGDPNRLEEAILQGTHDINEHAELEGYFQELFDIPGNLHDGVTPLLAAIANTKKNALLKLLNHSADVNNFLYSIHSLR